MWCSRTTLANFGIKAFWNTLSVSQTLFLTFSWWKLIPSNSIGRQKSAKRLIMLCLTMWYSIEFKTGNGCCTKQFILIFRYCGLHSRSGRAILFFYISKAIVIQLLFTPFIIKEYRYLSKISCINISFDLNKLYTICKNLEYLIKGY